MLKFVLHGSKFILYNKTYVKVFFRTLKKAPQKLSEHHKI